MPISKSRNAERMRAYRAKEKAQGTVLLPKALVRRLHKAGIQVNRYLTAAPVSLDDHHDLQRRLEATVARIEWQSGGIRMLHERVATLEARLATQPAMVDTASQQRIMALEADLARMEAMFTHRSLGVGGFDSVLHEERE